MAEETQKDLTEDVVGGAQTPLALEGARLVQLGAGKKCDLCAEKFVEDDRVVSVDVKTPGGAAAATKNAHERCFLLARATGFEQMAAAGQRLLASIVASCGGRTLISKNHFDRAGRANFQVVVEDVANMPGSVRVRLADSTIIMPGEK